MFFLSTIRRISLPFLLGGGEWVNACERGRDGLLINPSSFSPQAFAHPSSLRGKGSS